jgi:hypothetical protein
MIDMFEHGGFVRYLLRKPVKDFNVTRNFFELHTLAYALDLALHRDINMVDTDDFETLVCRWMQIEAMEDKTEDQDVINSLSWHPSHTSKLPAGAIRQARRDAVFLKKSRGQITGKSVSSSSGGSSSSRKKSWKGKGSKGSKGGDDLKKPAGGSQNGGPAGGRK